MQFYWNMLRIISHTALSTNRHSSTQNRVQSASFEAGLQYKRLWRHYKEAWGEHWALVLSTFCVCLAVTLVFLPHAADCKLINSGYYSVFLVFLPHLGRQKGFFGKISDDALLAQYLRAVFHQQTVQKVFDGFLTQKTVGNRPKHGNLELMPWHRNLKRFLPKPALMASGATFQSVFPVPQTQQLVCK